MGEARHRGIPEERKKQAIVEGRDKANRPKRLTRKGLAEMTAEEAFAIIGVAMMKCGTRRR